MYSTAISNLHSSCRHKEIYPQARYGFPRLHNHDHFGIDNGWNHLGPPMPDYQNVPDYGKYAKFLRPVSFCNQVARFTSTCSVKYWTLAAISQFNP